MTDSRSNSPIELPVPSYEILVAGTGGVGLLEEDHELQDKRQPSLDTKGSSVDNILLDIEDRIMNRRKLATELGNVCYTIHNKPKNDYSAKNMDDRKSTSKGCLQMGNNFVSWLTKK